MKTRECTHQPECTSCNWCDEFKLPEADHVIHVTDSETIDCYRADQVRDYVTLCMTASDRRIEELEKRVTELEKQKTEVPTQPRIPLKTCPKCGLGLAKFAGFVCMKLDCPAGRGPVLL